MINALAPRLTALDERVRAALSPDVGARLSDIAKRVYRPGRCRAATTEAELSELVGILRGLEHLGLARQAGGWWRRAA